MRGIAKHFQEQVTGKQAAIDEISLPKLPGRALDGRAIRVRERPPSPALDPDHYRDLEVRLVLSHPDLLLWRAEPDPKNIASAVVDCLEQVRRDPWA